MDHNIVDVAGLVTAVPVPDHIHAVEKGAGSAREREGAALGFGSGSSSAAILGGALGRSTTSFESCDRRRKVYQRMDRLSSQSLAVAGDTGIH